MDGHLPRQYPHLQLNMGGAYGAHSVSAQHFATPQALCQLQKVLFQNVRDPIPQMHYRLGWSTHGSRKVQGD